MAGRRPDTMIQSMGKEWINGLSKRLKNITVYPMSLQRLPKPYFVGRKGVTGYRDEGSLAMVVRR